MAFLLQKRRDAVTTPKYQALAERLIRHNHIVKGQATMVSEDSTPSMPGSALDRA
jgi:hypothetical protein